MPCHSVPDYGSGRIQLMKKRDLLWLLVYPLYQSIGTIRHEAGHALVAMWQGSKITEFIFIPRYVGEKFYFGYVSWEGGDTNWLVTAAPYFLDLLTFAVFFVICFWGRFKRHWVWLNLVIFGVISPVVNSGHQYFWVGLRGGGDIGWLLEKLDPVYVHAYLISTIGLYLVGWVLLFIESRHIYDRRAEASLANVSITEGINDG